MFTRARPLFSQVHTVAKRHASRKSTIQVRLNEYIEGLGIKDQVVSVRPGLMRNVLYPSGKACYVVKGAVSLDSTDSNEAESAAPVVDTHEQLLQQQVVANQVKHMVEQVQALHFKRAVVPGSEGIFGSVSVDDIVQALKEQGVELEKATVNLDSKIKQLGKHNVEITLADQSTVSLTVNVDAE